MKSYARSERVGELIREALSDILKKQVKDPRLEMTIITLVKMTRDLKIARIYYSISGTKYGKTDVSKGFYSAAGYIKRELARELKLRYMPELQFYYDDSFDYGSRIDSILKSVISDNGTDHSTAET